MLDAGANINQENADGETSLDLTIKLRHKKDLVDLLLEHGDEASGIKKKRKTKTRRNKRMNKKRNKRRSRKQRK